ncbi:GNAT family N-acetyltransferase [Solibacillus sp. FSL H8-0538]|uniref:GNAT family N-acetyltransferase n=1 Tax=Solibacillus sp. FSL H8-0538 TaxID=2921400 RepID=UPI0030F7903A
MKQDIILENDVVLLRRMTMDDVDSIALVGLDERIWPYLSVTLRTREDVEQYVKIAVTNQITDTEYPFVIIEKQTGKLVGSTRFMNISEQHKHLEIGSTWLIPNVWRTAINTNCKYLLLHYCFEELGLKRVQIKTDDENMRSKLAIARIGAKFEGILRQHMIRKDGTMRNTAMFSVVCSEWPETKGHIQKLL